MDIDSVRGRAKAMQVDTEIANTRSREQVQSPMQIESSSGKYIIVLMEIILNIFN
jgi:hypothetical protein